VSIIHLNDRAENGSAKLVTLPRGWTLGLWIAPSRNRAIQQGCWHLRANNLCWRGIVVAFYGGAIPSGC